MFGGEAGVFGGEASPPPPPLDRTLSHKVHVPAQLVLLIRVYLWNSITGIKRTQNYMIAV